jgi:hypothetical protein
VTGLEWSWRDLRTEQRRSLKETGERATVYCGARETRGDSAIIELNINGKMNCCGAGKMKKTGYIVRGTWKIWLGGTSAWKRMILERLLFWTFGDSGTEL